MEPQQKQQCTGSGSQCNNIGKVTLGYWDIRGLVRQIEVLLEYVGIPYQRKYFDGAKKFTESWYDDPEIKG